MKTLIALAVAVLALASVTSADAKGCLKGAERTDQDVTLLRSAGASFGGRGPSQANRRLARFRASRASLTPTSLFKQPIRFSNRHCEPTGRANARPMTGSAKQSIDTHLPSYPAKAG